MQKKEGAAISHVQRIGNLVAGSKEIALAEECIIGTLNKASSISFQCLPLGDFLMPVCSCNPPFFLLTLFTLRCFACLCVLALFFLSKILLVKKSA